MDKKGAGKLENYNVMKNVSTHSMINAPDGDRPGKIFFIFENIFFNFVYVSTIKIWAGNNHLLLWCKK